MTHRNLACAIALFVVNIAVAAAQLATPTITSSNVGWGWFDLAMSGASGTPSNTHWLITQDGVTVFDTWRRVGPDCDGAFFEMQIPNEFVADKRDLTTKRILGCLGDRTYSARVRYNDGTQWSAFSEPITITTPPEPTRSDDTLFVIVWGHSLAGFAVECGINNDIINGDGSDGFSVLYDGPSFTHALQTQLRRATGRTVTIINGAISGSRQSRWMRSGLGTDTAIDHQSFDTYEYNMRHHLPGGMFSDTRRYPIAVFFYGQNDARAGWCETRTYPASEYADDTREIIERLTALGVTVVYNSIHYATPIDCATSFWGGAPVAWSQEYFNTWDSLMTQLAPRNNRLVRGADLYTLFRSDTTRFHFPDGAHANTSEATPQIVDAITPFIVTAISKVSGSSADDEAIESSMSIVQTSTGLEARLSIGGAANHHTTLELYDDVGTRVATLVDREMGVGRHSVSLDALRLPIGPYLLVMRSRETTLARRFDVVR